MPTSHAVSADWASPFRKPGSRRSARPAPASGSRTTTSPAPRLRGGRLHLALQPRLVLRVTAPAPAAAAPGPRPRAAGAGRRPRGCPVAATLPECEAHPVPLPCGPRLPAPPSLVAARGRRRPVLPPRPRPGRRAGSDRRPGHGGQSDRSRRRALVHRAAGNARGEPATAGPPPTAAVCGRGQPGQRAQRHEAAEERRHRSCGQQPAPLHCPGIASLAAELDHGMGQRPHRPRDRRVKHATAGRTPASASRSARKPSEPAAKAEPRSFRPPVDLARAVTSLARARTRPSAISNSRVPAPPATRTTSHTEDTRRDPSGARVWWTTRSSALATCSRTAPCGSAISASVSTRRAAHPRASSRARW